MFDPITMALVGAAIGGLTNKKDPLKGAALGAAGGYFVPGLLGGSAAGGAAASGAPGLAATPGAGLSLVAPSGGSAAGGLGMKLGAGSLAAAPEAAAFTGGGLLPPAMGEGTSLLAANSPQLGLLGQLKTAAGYAKPIGEAAGAAQSVSGLLSSPEQPVMAPTPLPQTGTGSQTLAAIAQQGDQQTAAQMQADAQKRQMRRKMIQQMGVV